jgi:hypothetical protein
VVAGTVSNGQYNNIVGYTVYFTDDNEPDGIENATHNIVMI